MQALPGLSTGMQMGSAISDGLMQSRAFKAEAAVDQQNARLDLLQGALSEEDIRRRGRAVQGEAISALADGGGDVSGTSARDLIFENSLNIEMAAMNTRYGAAQAAQGDLYKAAAARQSAKSAIFKGIMGAGAAAITGASNFATNQQRMSAYFPGGQQLPMPSAVPPSYTSASPYRTPY